MKEIAHLFLLTVIIGCTLEPKDEDLFRKHCGSCHLAPSPTDLPKMIWEEKILPEMGARLGMKTPGFDPLGKVGWNEKIELTKMGAYPSKPKLTEEEWEKIKAYVMMQAPDTLIDNIVRTGRNEQLTLFSPKEILMDESKGAYITFLEFDKTKNRILAGDVYGWVRSMAWGGEPELLYDGRSPVTAFSETAQGMLVTEIGKMQPTELKSGKLVSPQPPKGEKKTVIEKLHRPVHTLVRDIDDDGVEEVFISEYGNQLGQLSLLEKTENGSYQTRSLLQVPGIVRVISADMNDDGREDLVLLAAQGDEGIYILFQGDDLTFLPERVLRFSSVWGSSWFELVDYDGDGHKDIITVQGDNADYSYVMKPYHGMRIFINGGKNGFTEKYFYPIHGATRVVAKDFDQDSDLDIAVTAYFPDYENGGEESFVYLENTNAAEFKFKSYIFSEAIKGRWLVMDAGDVDGDGDEDIILGSFAHAPVTTPKDLLKSWKESQMDLMVLINNLHENINIQKDQVK